MDSWARGWRESSFGTGRVGRVGQESFCAGQKKKNGVGQNFAVGGTKDSMKFYQDSTKFYLWCYSLLCILYSLHKLYFDELPLNSVYSKLTYFPLFPSDNIISKIEKVKSFSKILLFQDLVKLLFIQ